MDCKFTSVWSDGTIITTDCEYDPETGEVSSETSDTEVSDDAILEHEFITLPGEDEETLDVCTTCHSYVLKTVMNPGIGHNLNEEQECSDPDCDSNL